MRIIILIVSLFVLPFLGANAYAQSEPQKTWEPNSGATRTIKPLNLKSIIQGKSKASSSGSSSSKRSGPTSRNAMEVIREGGELPITQALSEDADYNPLRDAMRRYNQFDRMNDKEAEFELARISEQEQANLEKQVQRRNEFYLRHGMTDEYTRDFIRTKTGRLAKKQIRKEQRLADKEEREKEKLLAQQEKNKPPPGYYPFPSGEKEERKSSVIMPVARPAKDGEIKPFFYR